MEDFYFKSAKATFDMICDEMEAEETQGIIDTSPCGMGVREIFELDLAQFLMFLMSSDGKLDDNEVKAFELMTGRTDSKSEIFGKWQADDRCLCSAVSSFPGIDSVHRHGCVQSDCDHTCCCLLENLRE